MLYKTKKNSKEELKQNNNIYITNNNSKACFLLKCFYRVIKFHYFISKKDKYIYITKKERKIKLLIIHLKI